MTLWWNGYHTCTPCRPLGRLPDFPSRLETEMKLQKKFLYRQLLRRFQNEYASANLDRTTQVDRKKEQMRVWDVVVITDDKVKRCSWTSAKVEQLYKGRGGVIRNVKQKTAKSYFHSKSTLKKISTSAEIIIAWKITPIRASFYSSVEHAFT